jgi:hypothetical protein
MKKAVLLFVVVVVLAGGGSGCGSRPSPAPASPPAPTVTPLSLRAPGWEEVTVHTLYLEVEQSYPDIPDKEPEPIAEAAQRILSTLGISVVADGDPCDATLTLTVAGRALGAEYIVGGTCYSGADVEGQAALTVPGRPPLTASLAGRQGTPFKIEHCPKEPASAPFEVAWMEALLGGLSDLWGPQVLVQALGDESALVRDLAADALIEAGPEATEVIPALVQALGDSDEDMRASAAQALREIGPQAIDAVPALIQALGDSESHVSGSAFAALKAITGQGLGREAAAWQEWWDERPPGATVPPATAPPASVPPTPACTRNAVFQADVTIPDNTAIKAGQPFVKTWRIRNTGTCDWDASCRLTFVEGDQIGGPDWVTVPETPAGENADISVELVAPPEHGRYRGYWQMCVGESEYFGDRIYVQIISTE